MSDPPGGTTRITVGKDRNPQVEVWCGVLWIKLRHVILITDDKTGTTIRFSPGKVLTDIAPVSNTPERKV